MRDRNTLNKAEYLFHNIWWGVLLAAWYRRMGFRSLEGFTLGQSKAFLWGIIAITVTTGVTITWKKRRNFLSVTITLLLPFEVYTLVLYKPYFERELKIILFVAFALASVYLGLAMTGKLSRRRSKLHQIFSRAIHGVLGARTIVTCCGVCFLVMTLGSIWLGNPIIHPNVKATDSQTEAQTIEHNLETIMKLDDEVWKGLTPKEKIDVLQTIANIERNYLGIPGELNVGGDLINIDGDVPKTCGYYNDAKREIIIDLKHMEIDSPEEVVDTLCHEAFHAYEYSLIKAYEYIPDKYKSLRAVATFAQYKVEFSDYADSEESLADYYFQEVECDARRYAASAKDAYFGTIRFKQMSLQDD